MRVEYHPQVAQDLNGAVAEYNSKRAGLGDALREEVYGAIDRIMYNPRQHRVVEGEIRRCFVHRFPYSVLYREIGSDLVRVLVVRHHRQHQDFGLERR